MGSRRLDRWQRWWVLLAAAPAGAAPLELPATVPVIAESVVLDLDEATVEVVVDLSTEPALFAGLRSESGDARLHVEETGGSMVVRRSGEGRAPLLIQLSLGPEQRLGVAGKGLEIALRSAVAPGDEDPGPEDSPEGESRPEDAAASGGAAFDLEVERSSVQLFGVAAAAVTATESSFYADGTTGSLDLELYGGDVELRGHRGRLDLQGRDAQVWVGDLAGSLDFDFEGGGLIVQGGRGPCAGSLRGGSVEIDGWQGSVRLKGAGAGIEIRAPEEARLHVHLTGRDLDAVLAPFRGSLIADLRGGRLQIRDQHGNLRLQARDQADVTLERAGGDISLALRSAAARVRGVPRGRVLADVQDSRLELEGVAQLELVAERSEVRGSGLARLAKAQIADSYVELDLSELLHHPQLDLLGATEAWVILATPCSVKLTDEQLFATGIDVSGCRLEGDVARRDRLSERGVGGNRRLRLTARVGEDSTLRVEGRP